MAGIYIHIPYCRQACHYCSFHFSTNLNSKSRFVDALIKEIIWRANQLEHTTIESIYFGGGTPSILSSSELSDILSALIKNYTLSKSVEITLEVNPEDVNIQQLRDWKSLNINRLSIGVQSFIDRDLIYMNRVHSADQSHSALDLVSKSEIENVSVDLMFGLIESNIKEWETNLKTIDEYRITHLSVYNLTIEEQTVFAHWKAKEKLVEIPDAHQEEQFEIASSYLCSKGFDHYEISNYGLPGYHSTHNTNYWRRIPYLGFGPSAHSYRENTRSWNSSNNQTYIKMIESGQFTQEDERLDYFDIYNEIIMLGLRTKRGIDRNDLKSLPTEIQEHFTRTTKILFDKNILSWAQDHILLSPENWYLSDSFASELFISKT